MLLARVCVAEPRVLQRVWPAGCRALATSSPTIQVKTAGKEEEFRTLQIGWKKKEKRSSRTFRPPNMLPPRYKQQKTDQDWGNVWPAARTFHPASVPFPVRQGYPASGKPTPDKWGNAELMKIPNFLHLTPPVIKRQCRALKKFCTAWPAGLETATKQEKHFPVTISKSSYLHSSPSVRDPKARIVTLKVPLKSLDLDYHGRDKLLRLVGDRYDVSSDCLTLVADRCPLSKQNYDYCQYLLTVLYNESMKTEPWEHEKELADHEKYTWEGSPSQAAAQSVVTARGVNDPDEVLNEYECVVTDLHNEGEDETTIRRYKNSVMKLLGLAEPQDPAMDLPPRIQGELC